MSATTETTEAPRRPRGTVTRDESAYGGPYVAERTFASGSRYRAAFGTEEEAWDALRRYDDV